MDKVCGSIVLKGLCEISIYIPIQLQGLRVIFLFIFLILILILLLLFIDLKAP